MSASTTKTVRRVNKLDFGHENMHGLGVVATSIIIIDNYDYRHDPQTPSGCPAGYGVGGGTGLGAYHHQSRP